MTFKDAYNSYLIESRKSRYKEFFQDFLRYAGTRSGISQERIIDGIIKQAIEKLGREDRITWYLRYIKCIMYITDIVNRAEAQGKRRDDVILLPKYVTSYFYKISAEQPVRKVVEELPLSVLKAIVYRDMERQESIIDTFEHFLSLPIPKINDYKFENQKLENIISTFKRYEEEWREQGGDREINITDKLKNGDIEQILSFNSGKEGWFDLKRSSCREEGKSMRHCGNSPRSNTNDTILSFRTIKRSKNITLTIPHLTFILTEKGELTESKGKGNNKPAEKYHPYIIALLLLKDPKNSSSYLIKKIVGGGYMSQNNFYISDLSKENQERLFKERPDLKPR